MARLPTTEEIEAAEKALEPYKLALGKVAHAWNHMQEHIGLLFCEVADLHDSMGMAIWHALRSDRSQRDLLEAAAEVASITADWICDIPQAKADIDWLLKKVNALGDGRNSAIHAPILNMIGGEAELHPFTVFGNPNAEKLRGKDILAEFEWYESYFIALRRFAAQLTRALRWRRRPENDPMPWPERPLLPTVRPRSGHQDRSHPSGTE